MMRELADIGADMKSPVYVIKRHQFFIPPYHRLCNFVKLMAKRLQIAES
jgi:hypothetical protein